MQQLRAFRKNHTQLICDDAAVYFFLRVAKRCVSGRNPVSF
jgi:hypothetical protein